jgi:hypothetical protein
MTALSKKTATAVYHENGETVCRYHQTAIVRASGNKVTLDSGGWRTVTTIGWYVLNRDTLKRHDFHDGMTLEY